MAKSTRSKVKRSYRSKKRETGVYAAHEAARLQRLNAKLTALTTAEVEGEAEEEDEEAMPEDGVQAETGAAAGAMEVDEGAQPSSSTQTEKRVSTHGPRNARRESWRASKGLAPRPKARGMNRQGMVAAKRKSGRSHRRR